MTADFLVIGAGIAGLSFAIRAAKHGSVVVLTKGDAFESNTAWAQGGIASVLPEGQRDEGDSGESHVLDTLDAGAGLCKESAVRTIVQDGAAAIEDLVNYGVSFDRENSHFQLGKEGGHSHRRILHARDTTGLEIAAQARSLGITDATVLTCCGGGGLTAGIALALEAHAAGMKVRPVEPAGFDDTARSLAAGQILRNPATTGSLCDAILTPAPGQMTFPILQRLSGPGLAVSDDQALHAMALAFTHLRIVLEPGGAVALAAALFAPDLPDCVICTASGGNVDAATFQTALARFPA
jgi:hypothetical protein